MPKSSHRKKEKPSRKKRLPAGLKFSQSSGKKVKPSRTEEVSFTSNANVAEERKKRRLIALTFCDYISQDKAGKMSLVGCFDNIYRDKETKQTGVFYLYARTAGHMKGRTEVTFLDPKNKPVVQVSYDVTTERVPPDKPAHAQFYTPLNFVAEEVGVYWIDVAYDGESLGGRDLTIAEHETKEGEDERSNTK